MSIITQLQNKQLPIFQTLKAKNGELILKGQGTVQVQPRKNAQFSIYLTVSKIEIFPSYALVVNQANASFYRCYEGKETLLCESQSGTGLDRDEKCLYWFSLDSVNHCLRYGKGEQRDQTTIMRYSPKRNDSGETEIEPWIDGIQYIHISGVNSDVEEFLVGRDPVTIEPPLLIVPRDIMTMEMAAAYKATVVENLTIECQKLYANVAGEQFQLNTPDFPFFSEAIEQSIQDPQGWCYQTLKKKEEEFGKPDINATYLRITLGVNQGESPGIPYVLEIWPNRHYSPIHNHAGANAAIKVLYGEITVKLFDMLSVSHTVPFKKVKLKQGDITWIAPRLNQTHQLHNENEDGTICVTIQCYLYDIENNSHYEFFNYIDNDGSTIGNFLPNSDMDFLEFRDKMKSEWEARNRK
ncbi:MAG: cysteine dioxygenase family protein [Microcoleus sp.]